MPTAVFSVAPMPEPVSRYQPPLNCLGSMPAAFHSLSSALWVPESSPREAKGAAASLILASEAVTSLLPARSEEHTSELQSLMRISYAVFCLKQKMIYKLHTIN